MQPSSLIHYQYGRRPTMGAIVERIVPGVPSMSVLFDTYTCSYSVIFAVIALFIFYSECQSELWSVNIT